MSEHGFYHASRGYWQTTDTPPAEILAAYPAGTVEVPIRPSADHQWQNGAWVYVAPPPDPPVDIHASRAAAVAAINRRAGEVRVLFVTDIPAQQMIYLAKESEARRYVAASPEPATLEGYPWLAGEVGSTAPTAMELAMLWLSMAGMWTVMGTSIEQIRMGHINQMDHPDITTEAISSVLASAMAAFDQIAANAP